MSIVSLSIKQGINTIFNKENWVVSLDSNQLCLSCVDKIIKSMKVSEKCISTIRSEYIMKKENENNIKKYGINKEQNVEVDIELIEFIRVDLLYKDPNTYWIKYKDVENGISPDKDSSIKCKKISKLKNK